LKEQPYKAQYPQRQNREISLFYSASINLALTIMSFISSVQIALLALFGTGFAQTVDGSKYNNPTAGPPASYFAAATTIPVAALQSAAAKASTAAQDATYPINGDSGAKKVTIHGDWSNFSEVCEPIKPIRN
jgi:hypothetical protein